MSPNESRRLFEQLDRMENRLDGVDEAIRGSTDGHVEGINARLKRVERSLRKRKCKLRASAAVAASAMWIAAKRLLVG